ncbi:MAG: ABC transporter ATP-binding protein [Flavobacteriaceae bacterium]|jgi:ABC-2 type transport system ATP-binding protein|nr:ABC transporter ATP-binding protein [Flavobacteriaceae bacterium]
MFKLDNIQVKYKDITVLDNLSLELHKGSIFGVLGSNGAGKTTLFETIYQNTKYTGKILLNNSPINKKSISYLESENYFYPYLSVKDILNLFTSKVNKTQIKRLIDFFNIPENSVVETLSLGTQKKLAVICNILLDREIYLFDEPFNGLDFESVEKLYLILKELQKKAKIILISSHVLETLTNCCDNIGLLKNGSFAEIYDKENFHLIRSFFSEKILQDWRDYNIENS